MSQPPPPPRQPVIGTAIRRATTLVYVVLLGGAGVLGYQVVRNGVAADVYKERLTELSGEYEELAQDYNKAVTRSAVTELVVAEGKVCVNVRTPDGRVETHPVQANPAHPIYVDYVVKDSRLLIRRVFDSQSAPDDAGTLNSALLDIDWADPSIKHGQAIYRQLTDGRWIVTVSGDGSLALAQVDDNVEVQLMPAPTVEDFDPVGQTRAQVKEITPVDVLKRFFGG